MTITPAMASPTGVTRSDRQSPLRARPEFILSNGKVAALESPSTQSALAEK